MKIASLQIAPANVVAFRQALATTTQRMTEAADRSMDISAATAFSQSQDRVPKRTGALAGSGKVVKQNTAALLRRIIGYGDSSLNPLTGRATSTYAMSVHEIYRAAYPGSYKWLELTIRQYGRDAFLHDLASNIRAMM